MGSEQIIGTEDSEEAEGKAGRTELPKIITDHLWQIREDTAFTKLGLEIKSIIAEIKNLAKNCNVDGIVLKIGWKDRDSKHEELSSV